MMKRKYNVKLQELQQITLLIKSFDTDVKEKAMIFEEAQLKMFMMANMESTYWLVRQAIWRPPPPGMPGLSCGENGPQQRRIQDNALPLETVQ